MPTNLTGQTIASTYDQLLHVDDGPTSAEKTVYSGTGVATALKVGTTSVSVGNVQLTGNTVQSLSGDLTLGTNLAFASPFNARTALGLGSLALQDANNVNISGGSISGVTLSGTLSGLSLVSSTTLTGVTTTNGGNLRMSGNTLSSQNANGNIDITPNGSGEVNVTNIDVLSGKVPFGVVTDRAYAAFSDVTDQTGSVSAATAVKFGTTDITGAGITMVTDGSNLTRLTFAAAGTYMVSPSLQFANADSADHDVTIWFALDGTNIARSATVLTVPKAADGGKAPFQIVFYVTVTAGQYVQVQWLPENIAVTLDHTAAGAIAPAIPSAVVVSERIA